MAPDSGVKAVRGVIKVREKGEGALAREVGPLAGHRGRWWG